MSKPTEWPTTGASPTKSSALRAASAGLGAPLTSLSVMPCIWLPTMGRPGFTSVDQRSVILPPLTRTAATSRRSAILGSVPVVSTSTTTNSPDFAWSAKARTDPIDGSRYGRRFALPTAARSCSWMSTIGASERCPNRIASAMTSSGRILTPASTIMMASRVPETTRSSSDSASCEMVGLRTNSPPIRPTRTAAIGPWNGISLIVRAADAAIVPRMSGSFSWSVDMTVITTWTSSLYPSGNSGRIGRSVRRAARIAPSEARASRLMKPPGILPAAYIRSSKSTVSGKKSRPGRGSDRFAVPRTRVSP